MLTEDFQPWLIEINSSPSMEASTSVTAKLCHKVLDDTIKGGWLYYMPLPHFKKIAAGSAMIV